MDPQSERTPGLALPQPAHEQVVPGGMPQGAGMGVHEVLLPPAEAPPAGAMPLSSAATLPAGGAHAPQTSVAAPVPVAPVAATPDEASDALDEVWVNKAKAIVEQTKHDPFLESRELGKVKADYLRVRYNKHIKVAEEQST